MILFLTAVSLPIKIYVYTHVKSYISYTYIFTVSWNTLFLLFFLETVVGIMALAPHVVDIWNGAPMTTVSEEVGEMFLNIYIYI